MSKCHYCHQEITEKEEATSIPSGVESLHYPYHTFCYKKWKDEKYWEEEMQRLARLARQT